MKYKIRDFFCKRVKLNQELLLSFADRIGHFCRPLHVAMQFRLYLAHVAPLRIVVTDLQSSFIEKLTLSHEFPLKVCSRSMSVVLRIAARKKRQCKFTLFSLSN